MLGRLPHPTLQPISHDWNGSGGKDDSRPKLPPRAATGSWNTHQRPNSPTDSSSVIPSNRTCSPIRPSKFPPFLQIAKHRSISPEPVSLEEAAEFAPNPTGDNLVQPKPDTRTGTLASWFNGSSDPVNITLVPSPSKERQEPFFDCAEMEGASARSSVSREPDSMTRRPQATLTNGLSVARKDTPGSKLAFWRSKTPAASDKYIASSDKLADFNILAALFPLGMTNVLSEESFKDLQANAESTIHQLQTVHGKNLLALREVTSEKNVLSDELEAARMRSEHLKLQLADLAAQSAERDSAMQTMVEELAALRHKVREDAEFRGGTLSIVSSHSSPEDERCLGEGLHNKKRHSGDTFNSEDSSPGSVFSLAEPGTCTPISLGDSLSEVYQTPRFDGNIGEPLKECQNCHGVKRSEAWDVVHILKEESKALKMRIAQCESANDDALGLLQVVSAGR